MLIYANPFSKTKSKIDYYAEWYVYPYFSQGWNLFVPPPNTNYKLFVEYEENDSKSIRIKRTDLFEEILLNHQSNRLRGYGPLVQAFANSIHYFEKNTVLQKKLNGPIKNDTYFTILEESSLNYLNNTRHLKLNKVKIRLVVQTLNSDSMKVYFN